MVLGGTKYSVMYGLGRTFLGGGGGEPLLYDMRSFVTRLYPHPNKKPKTEGESLVLIHT